MNLDFDFSPWTGEDLRNFRKYLWVSRAELQSHPNYPATYPSTSDMAARVGVSAEQWRRWEREGTLANGWSALLRIYEEEGRDIRPINCSVQALEALEVLGNYSELALALEVDRRTITKWRYSIGYVPGVYGYGRLVRIVFEDLILPPKARPC